MDLSAVAEASVAWHVRDLLAVVVTVRPSYLLEGSTPTTQMPREGILASHLLLNAGVAVLVRL